MSTGYRHTAAPLISPRTGIQGHINIHHTYVHDVQVYALHMTEVRMCISCLDLYPLGVNFCGGGDHKKPPNPRLLTPQPYEVRLATNLATLPYNCSSPGIESM